MSANLPDAENIREAHARIAAHVHHTPVLTSTYFNRLLGADLFFKAENFQKVGAFKARGATNAVFSLSQDEIDRGVVTHSSGNHAQALSRAARLRGARATIVMPRTSPAVKRAAVAGYGAEIVPCEPTLESRVAETERLLATTGGMFIHPFNDPRVIAGQATAARELFADTAPLDILLAPVGGGGLLAGTALAASYFSPTCRVIGTEPAGADDAFRSLAADRLLPQDDPQTIADGLRTSLGPLTFAAIRKHVEAIVTVEDDIIIDTMRQVWERMKIVIEPSAAVPLAALVAHKLDVRGRRVGIILSGGNVDLDHLPWRSG